MTKAYRPSFGMRLGNGIVTVLLRCGLRIGAMALLTVPGRKSGVPRTTPVALGEHDGRRWLLSPYGEVNWVRNLRAAGRGTITRGRRSEQFTAVPLAPQEAAPILKLALAGAPAFLLRHFAVAPDAPLADFEREAVHHPVFLLQPTSSR